MRLYPHSSDPPDDMPLWLEIFDYCRLVALAIAWGIVGGLAASGCTRTLAALVARWGA